MKKLLSILVAAILVASVFTSCSSDDEGNKFEAGWYWVTEDEDYKMGDKGKYNYLIYFDEEGYSGYSGFEDGLDNDGSKYYGRFDFYDEDYIDIDEEKKEITSFNTPETIPLEKIYYKNNDNLPNWIELSYEELKAYVDNKKTYDTDEYTILWSDLKKESERKYTWSD